VVLLKKVAPLLCLAYLFFINTAIPRKIKTIPIAHKTILIISASVKPSEELVETLEIVTLEESGVVEEVVVFVFAELEDVFVFVVFDDVFVLELYVEESLRDERFIFIFEALTLQQKRSIKIIINTVNLNIFFIIKFIPFFFEGTHDYEKI
jgi:hypothetical protein